MYDVDEIMMKLKELECIIRQCINTQEFNFHEEAKEGNDYKIIEIHLDNGNTAIFDSTKGDWDDYAYDGMAFVVMKENDLVGIYNMNNVVSISIK